MSMFSHHSFDLFFYPFGKLVIPCGSRRDWMGLSKTNLRSPEIVGALLRCFVLFCVSGTNVIFFYHGSECNLKPALSRKGEKMRPVPQVGARG